jgi:hypothetical protein
LCSGYSISERLVIDAWGGLADETRAQGRWRHLRGLSVTNAVTVTALHVGDVPNLRITERCRLSYRVRLILAAVAIVVFVTYEVMGQDIGSLVNNIDTALTSAS